MFDGIWEGMVAFFFVCIGLAILFGMLLMFAAPKLWELIKPWLHSLTS